MEFEKNVVKWAYERNLIDGSSAGHQLEKLLEEIGELCAGIATNNREKALDSIGDSAVVLTIIAEQMGSSFSECANLAWDEIKDRKGMMIDGVFVKESDLPSPVCGNDCISPAECVSSGYCVPEASVEE